MKYIKLPIKFRTLDEEVIDEYEILGLDIPEDEGEEGTLYINNVNISEFNEDSNGNIRLVMNSGNSITVYMSMLEFLDLINGKDE